MGSLQELYEVTKEINTVLDEEITNQNREQIIERANELIEKREQLIKNVTPPFSKSDNKIGRDIVKLNEMIERKLEQVFTQLKEEMRNIQRQKKSNRTYINPYGPIKTIDGMYVDSKQ